MALIYCFVVKLLSLEKTPNAVCELLWEVFTFGMGSIKKMAKISNIYLFILCVHIWDYDPVLLKWSNELIFWMG